MSDFATHVAAHRRHALLRFLREAGGICSARLLLSAIEAAVDRRATGTLIEVDLDWLRARGLVTDEWIEGKDPMRLARITERGLDVAAGKVDVEGVARPPAVG